jgi:hypothetical protein
MNPWFSSDFGWGNFGRLSPDVGFCYRKSIMHLIPCKNADRIALIKENTQLMVLHGKFQKCHHLLSQRLSWKDPLKRYTSLTLHYRLRAHSSTLAFILGVYRELYEIHLFYGIWDPHRYGIRKLSLFKMKTSLGERKKKIWNYNWWMRKDIFNDTFLSWTKTSSNNHHHKYYQQSSSQDSPNDFSSTYLTITRLYRGLKIESKSSLLDSFSLDSPCW